MSSPRKPLQFYRLWCGKKRYSGWLPDRYEVFRVALREGLAYGEDGGEIGLGPLTWIEQGERRYARSRTVPVAGPR